MIGIDTNVLVRYLIEDDDAQCIRVQKLIEQYKGIKGALFINNAVVCETLWVCERGYKYSKQQVIALLKSMLSTVEFSFEDNQLLWLSATEYEHSSFADFPDVLIGLLNISRGCDHTVTFDKKASNLEAFILL